MSIKNIIVHEIIKTDDDLGFKINPRDTENTINDKAEGLLDKIKSLYNKTGLALGGFTNEKDGITKPFFETHLENHYKSEKFSNFIDYSLICTKHLVQLLRKTTAKGGYLLFTVYESKAKIFLSIVLLKKTTDTTINPNSLDIEDIELIDLGHLHMAARISLADWPDENKHKYISFRKGKETSDIRNYFQKFIGCEEFIKIAEDTRALVAAVSEFCKLLDIKGEEKIKVQSFVHLSCIEWMSDDEDVKISSLSEMLDAKLNLDDENKGKFLEVAQNDPFNLTNELKIEKTYLKALVKYSLSIDGLKLEIDHKWYKSNVDIDQKNGMITLKNIPADQLKQFV